MWQFWDSFGRPFLPRLPLGRSLFKIATTQYRARSIQSLQNKEILHDQSFLQNPHYVHVYSYNQWNYFQLGCIDKWVSADFSIQTWCIPLEAFTSKIGNWIIPFKKFSMLRVKCLSAFNAINCHRINTCSFLSFFYFPGLWNYVFLFSNLALFILMPFAYFFTESEGFSGSRNVRIFSSE